MKRITILLFPVLFLCSCATKPHTYQPPDPGKLKASTQRVSVAVDQAHTHAREAKTKVDEASKIAKEVQEETKKIKDVPLSLVEGNANLERKLDETKKVQAQLEADLREADTAKAQAKSEESKYITEAEKLAATATSERDARIKAEKEASYLKWHSWLYRILGGIGVLLIAGLLVLWLTGKLAWKLSG